MAALMIASTYWNLHRVSKVTLNQDTHIHLKTAPFENAGNFRGDQEFISIKAQELPVHPVRYHPIEGVNDPFELCQAFTMLLSTNYG